MRNLGTLKAKNEALKKQNSTKNQLNLKAAKKQNLAEIQVNLSNKNAKKQKSMKIQPNLRNENLKATKNAKNSTLQANLKHKKRVKNLSENEQNLPNLNLLFMQFLQFLSQKQNPINQALEQENPNANLEFLNQILGANLTQNSANLHEQILANLNSQNRDFSQNFANLNENFKQNLSLNLTNHLNNFNKIFDELAKAKALINEASQTMQKLENKDLSQAELEAFLRKLNFPLLGGVALGVLASILLSEISPKE